MKKSFIDLQSAFGNCYRIDRDTAQVGENGRTYDPWLLVIPGRHGHIYPHNDKLLGVAINRRGATCSKLAAIPSLEVKQDASDGLNGVFPLDAFPQVAAICTRSESASSHQNRRRPIPRGCDALVERELLVIHPRRRRKRGLPQPATSRTPKRRRLAVGTLDHFTANPQQDLAVRVHAQRSAGTNEGTQRERVATVEKRRRWSATHRTCGSTC